MTKVEDPETVSTSGATASIAFMARWMAARLVDRISSGTSIGVSLCRSVMMARLDQEKNLPKVRQVRVLDIGTMTVARSVSSMPSPCQQSCTCPHHAKMRAKLERRAAREARNDRGKRSS